MPEEAGGVMKWTGCTLALLLLLLGGCKTQLYTALNQQDAMEMVAILLQHGIAADRMIMKDGSSTIEVDSGWIADAVTLLRENRYPRTGYESMGDLFKPQGMISSPTAEHARYDYGLSQELSRTLSDIDGVITARVHIVLPDNDPLNGDGKPSAAAVFIRYDARVDLDKMLPQIKTMMADSVEGLTYAKVSVVLLPVTLPPVAPLLPEKREAGFNWEWLFAGAMALGGSGFAAWNWRGRWLPKRREDVSVAAVPQLRRVS